MEKNSEFKELYKAVLSLKNEEQCEKFFEDLCTIKELETMSQRLEVAKMLLEGKTFNVEDGKRVLDQVFQGKILLFSSPVYHIKKVFKMVFLAKYIAFLANLCYDERGGETECGNQAFL